MSDSVSTSYFAHCLRRCPRQNAYGLSFVLGSCLGFGMLVWLPCFRSTSHSAGCAQLKWNSLKQAHQQYHIHQAFISFAKYVTLLIQVFVSQDSIPRAFWKAPVAHPTHWQSGSASSQSSSEGYAMVCVQKFKNTPIDWLEELIYVFIPKKNIFQICGFVGANFETYRTYPTDTRLMFIAESS